MLAPSWATVCKTVRPMLSDRCPVCLSILSVTLVHCGQTVGRIKMKLGMQVGLGPGQIVLDENQLPLPQRGGGEAPNFRPISAVAKTAGWIEMVGLLSMEVGLSRSNLDVRPRWGPSSPYPKRRLSLPPQFSAHFYCGQTAECIKMPLGTEVGLGPDNIVLDGDPARPPPKGHSPQFSAHICSGQMAACIKMPLGMEVALRTGDFV